VAAEKVGLADVPAQRQFEPARNRTLFSDLWIS
jgi:hypothetical protein